jgi:hypothetical protein
VSIPQKHLAFVGNKLTPLQLLQVKSHHSFLLETENYIPLHSPPRAQRPGPRLREALGAAALTVHSHEPRSAEPRAEKRA